MFGRKWFNCYSQPYNFQFLVSKKALNEVSKTAYTCNIHNPDVWVARGARWLGKGCLNYYYYQFGSSFLNVAQTEGNSDQENTICEWHIMRLVPSSVQCSHQLTLISIGAVDSARRLTLRLLTWQPRYVNTHARKKDHPILRVLGLGRSKKKTAIPLVLVLSQRGLPINPFSIFSVLHVDR